MRGGGSGRGLITTTRTRFRVNRAAATERLGLATRYLPMSIRQSLLLSFLLASASAMTHAQAPPSSSTPPQATAPTSQTRSGDCSVAGASAAPVLDGVTTGQSSEPLGDKLAKSNGVLCPPAGVDPEIHAPTPEGGNTPVIPPPGSPGGNPNVQPK